MNGFNVSEAGHVIEVISPQSIGGGIIGQAFSMKNAEHVSIIISLGVCGATAPTITLAATQTSSASPATSTPIPFRAYLNQNLPGSSGTNNDILSPPTYYTTAGFTFPVANNQYAVIELDAAELDFLGGGDSNQINPSQPYLNLIVTSAAVNTLLSAVAILSGVRFQYQGNPKQTS